MARRRRPLIGRLNTTTPARGAVWAEEVCGPPGRRHAGNRSRVRDSVWAEKACETPASEKNKIEPSLEFVEGAAAVNRTARQ